ncbi:hypothetical protein P4909_22925 [Escherichia coli]
MFNDSAVRNFSYTLNVKNSYGEAVDITLLDQIPVSANSDITVGKKCSMTERSLMRKQVNCPRR